MQIAASQQPAAIFAIAVIYPVAENSARTDGADEVQFVPAGPCALWHGQPGQVGNEAATAISCKCRRQGSPLPQLFVMQIAILFLPFCHSVILDKATCAVSGMSRACPARLTGYVLAGRSTGRLHIRYQCFLLRQQKQAPHKGLCRERNWLSLSTKNQHVCRVADCLSDHSDRVPLRCQRCAATGHRRET